jgi:hypothetical protein
MDAGINSFSEPKETGLVAGAVVAEADSSSGLTSGSDSVPLAFNPQLTPGAFCLYSTPQAKDGECDLCARSGGVLQYFSLSAEVSTLNAPSAEGYLGHAPCIFWLAHSRLLDPTPLAPLGSASNGAVTKDNAPPARSRFDKLLNRWRCGLCGRHTGITVRCCAAGCAVRCHPLCAQIAGPGWLLCSLTGEGTDGGGNESQMEDRQALGMLCCTHSNQQLFN